MQYLQTPGGMGPFDGGSQGEDPSGFIPASYGAMYSNANFKHAMPRGVPVEESTLELRRAMLHTRHCTAFLMVSS